MQILFVHTDRFTRNFLNLCLAGRAGADVTAVNSFQAAMDVLLADTSVDLIIVDQDSEKEKLLKYLSSVDAKIPIVILTNANANDMSEATYPDLSIAGIVPNQGLPDRLLEIIKGLNLAREERQGIEAEYCRIATDLLVKVVPLKGDVFIRLSQIKFVKLFRTGAQFSKDDLQRFLEKKKLDHLYIRKSDVDEFIGKLKDQVLGNMQIIKGSPAQILESFRNIASLHETVHELTLKVGFTPEVQAIAREQIDLSMKFIGGNPKISEFLQLTQYQQKSYLSSHSLLLANLACCIAARMEWPSSQTFLKLTIAAMFHDLALNDPQLMRIQSKVELENQKNVLTPTQYSEVLNHAHRSYELIGQLKDIPPDVDLIIQQHHERADESGFPHGIGASKIAPLSAVIIVAHEILNDILAKGSSFSMADFSETKKDIYSRGTFKKILAIL